MKFCLVDLAGHIPAADALAWAAAQQRQLREHVAVRYEGVGSDAVVRVASGLADVRLGEFPVRIHPTAPADKQGELGDHGWDGADLYWDLIAKYGEDWRITASHEVLEALLDRWLHACVELDDGAIWDREVCDRVEAENYPVDGVPLSNWNTPECFEPPPGSTIVSIVAAAGGRGGAYDWMGTSSRPNEVRPGGYAQQYQPGVGWTEHGEMRPYRAELKRLNLSRGARRAARAGAVPSMTLDQLADSLGLSPEMIAVHPLDPSIAFGADPRRGIAYLIAVDPEGASVLRRWTAQQVEAARSLLDRQRCIIESGVGSMR